MRVICLGNKTGQIKKQDYHPTSGLELCGWYLMALIDVMDVMDESIYDMYRELGELFKETLKGLLKYRDVETGLFIR